MPGVLHSKRKFMTIHTFNSTTEENNRAESPGVKQFCSRGGLIDHIYSKGDPHSSSHHPIPTLLFRFREAASPTPPQRHAFIGHVFFGILRR